MQVLVGVDGTERSIGALEEAIERAQIADDEVTVAVFDDPSTNLNQEQAREAVRDVLEENGVDLPIREIDGDPGAQLVDLAEANDFDQVVIGDGTRSPMGKIRLDTIAQFVLFNSLVTVKLVR